MSFGIDFTMRSVKRRLSIIFYSVSCIYVAVLTFMLALTAVRLLFHLIKLRRDVYSHQKGLQCATSFICESERRAETRAILKLWL